MPTRSRRNRASPSSSSPPRSTPSTSTRARARPLDAADDRHQAGLAGARRAHHAYAGAGLDVEVDAAQDRDRPGGARKGEMDVRKLDHRQRPAPRSPGPDTAHARVEMDRGLRRTARLGGAACDVAALAAGTPALACRLARARRFAGRRLRRRARRRRFRPGSSRRCAERGVDCAVLNAGVSGDTSAGGLGAARMGAGRPAHAPAGGARRQRRAARTCRLNNCGTISTKLFDTPSSEACR